MLDAQIASFTEEFESLVHEQNSIDLIGGERGMFWGKVSDVEEAEHGSQRRNQVGRHDRLRTFT
ncbi:hypothetical protein A9310_17330 [Gordonia sp. UCD-TK1]|nr:hypothetical protein A9310_17330 [Gordonia sp. UCD-TK1]